MVPLSRVGLRLAFVQRGRPTEHIVNILMGTRLFIGNLNYRTTEDGLGQFIATVAPLANKTNREGREITDRDGHPVAAVSIPLDRETSRPRGFAFVELQSEDGAKAVIDQLNGQDLDGRAIRINEAQPAGTGPGAPRSDAPQAEHTAPKPAEDSQVLYSASEE